MDRHERAARIAALSTLIREKEKELDTLLNGGEPEPIAKRSQQRCSVCQQVGHTARNCPTKENVNGHTRTVEATEPDGPFGVRDAEASKAA